MNELEVWKVCWKWVPRMMYRQMEHGGGRVERWEFELKS